MGFILCVSVCVLHSYLSLSPTSSQRGHSFKFLKWYLQHFLSNPSSHQQTSVSDPGVGPHSSYFGAPLTITLKVPALPSLIEPSWDPHLAERWPKVPCMYLLKRYTLPLTFFPKPIEESFLFICSLVFDFSLMTSSSLTTSAENFFFFFFLCRGGSFFGKVNIGNITRNIAMAQRRNPLHLKNWEMWVAFMASVWSKNKSERWLCHDNTAKTSLHLRQE